MAKERTLALVKPNHFDTHYRNPGPIENAYKLAGLEIVKQTVFTFSPGMARSFYAEHMGKPFFPNLIREMTSHHCVAYVLEGEDAVSKVREINGATDPRKADPASIRGSLAGRFDPQNMAANFVHGSDSVDAAEREIALVFTEEL